METRGLRATTDTGNATAHLGVPYPSASQGAVVLVRTPVRQCMGIACARVRVGRPRQHVRAYACLSFLNHRGNLSAHRAQRVAPSPRRALWCCECVGNAIGHLVFTSHGRPFAWRGVAWRCGRPSLSRTTRGEAPRPPSLLSSLGGVAFCAARQTGPCEPPLPPDRSPNCRGFLPMSPFPIPPIIPRPSLSLPLAAPMLRRRCAAARFRGAAVARPSSAAG